MTGPSAAVELASRSRERSVESVVRESRRWSRHAGRLVNTLESVASDSPRLLAKVEGLRHRRDTLAIKADAVDRLGDERSARLLRELETARLDLRTAWRSVMHALDREGVYP